MTRSMNIATAFRGRVKDRRPRNAAPQASLMRARTAKDSHRRLQGGPAPEAPLSRTLDPAEGTAPDTQAITRDGVEKAIARQRGNLIGGRL